MNARWRWLTIISLGLVLALGGSGCGDDSQTCVFRQAEEGSRILVCPDGSRVRLPSVDQEQPAGGIRGTARYFGRENHEGIAVQVAGLDDRVALTDADGSFSIPDVPAGFRQLTFAARGYEPAVRRDLMVLPGAWVAEEVELRIGRLVLDGKGWELLPSPDGEVVLAWRPGGQLHRIDPLALQTERIADRVEEVFFSPDGSKVAMLAASEPPESVVRLVVYEIDRRRKLEVASRVDSASFTPDGETLIFTRRADGSGSLETWHHPTGRRVSVTRDVMNLRMSEDGATLLVEAYSPAGRILIVWDLASAGGTSLGNLAVGPIPTFGPDGRSFIFYTRAGDVVLWDGRRNETQILSDGLSMFRFSESGDQLLYLASGTLFHHDLRTSSRFEIATGVVGAAFAPDGETLGYFRPAEGSPGEWALTTWDRESRASTVHAVTDRFPASLLFSPDASHLFFGTNDGRLHAFSEEEGIREISADTWQLPTFSPNGRSYLFYEGDELIWADLASGDSLSLGAPISPFHNPPPIWDERGERLLYVQGADGYGSAFLFRPETRSIEKVAGGTFLEDCHFLSGDSILALRRQARHTRRGELAIGEMPLVGGVSDYRFTADGSRLLARTDALPVRDVGVLALWDQEGGLTPADAGVSRYHVHPDHLTWVAESGTSAGRAGVYVSHYPRNLPPPPPPEEEEESDSHTEEEAALSSPASEVEADR